MNSVFYMKKFTILLLSVIFVTLIAGSVQSISADDPVDNKVVSENADRLDIIPTKNSKYEIYTQVVVRTAQGELISVTETSQCKFGKNCSTYMPNKITDYGFDTWLGNKEIITVDNIKYEKVQFSNSSEYSELFDMSDREPTGRWEVQICGEPAKKFGYECANIFYSRTSVVYLEAGDVTTNYWIILREMN